MCIWIIQIYSAIRYFTEPQEEKSLSDSVVIALNGVSSAVLILKVRGIVLCNFVAPGGAGECKKSSARPDLLGYYLVRVRGRNESEFRPRKERSRLRNGRSTINFILLDRVVAKSHSHPLIRQTPPPSLTTVLTGSVTLKLVKL